MMGMLETEKFLAIFKTLLTSRLVDEKMSKLVKQNKGGTFQLSATGHELIGAVAAQKLRPGVDWACPYYRDQAMAIGWGCDLVEQFGAFLGRVTLHHSGGRMMPYHYSHHPLRIPTQSSVVGSQWLPATGIAHGVKKQNLKEVVYVSGGDGATSEGDFHEALNYAGLHQLPVIFVVHDNGWAISVPVREQIAGGSIAQALQAAPGVVVHAVDGTQYPPLATAFEAAVARALGGEGPSVIVAKVPRLSAHSNSDDPGKYRPKEDVEKDMKLDPLPAYKRYLLEEGVCSEEEMQALEEEIRAEVEEAASLADQLPFPSLESAQEHVFKAWNCPISCPKVGQKETEEKIVMVDAINAALVEEMERDEGVVVLGEDVAYGKGGVFGVTRGLTAKFGDERCFNTPLAEATIVGVALGLSLDGFHKPVAEIQFADYLWPAFDLLASEIASIHYRSAGQWEVPLVLRMPYGGYIQGGPYHSQSIEAILAHCPGLKIVIPSNAADAKGLLKAAIRDPNPVIFLEHKALYRQAKFCARIEPGPNYLIPFGKASVVREGQDLTVVGWGMMVVMAMDVASKLAQEGIDIEVIDLRTIIPCDTLTIVESVKKTGKLVIAHEAPRTSGFGGEIAAQVAEAAFEYLDGPITRVCGLDAPVPYSKPLETAVLPQPSDLEKAIRDLYSY